MFHHCYLAAPVQTSANVTLIIRGLIHPRNTDERKGANKIRLPSCTPLHTSSIILGNRGAGEQHRNQGPGWVRPMRTPCDLITESQLEQRCQEHLELLLDLDESWVHGEQKHQAPDLHSTSPATTSFFTMTTKPHSSTVPYLYQK